MSRNESGKTEFFAVRMSRSDAEALRLQANQSGLTVSALIRRRVTGQEVTSCTDLETAKSIDRLGRMLKHLYPKDKDWASPEDRKRWWALVTELESTAKSLRR
jgi:Mobilization protein NikA